MAKLVAKAHHNRTWPKHHINQWALRDKAPSNGVRASSRWKSSVHQRLR